MRTLPEYEIDPQTGFVPAVDPLERLHSGFDAWETIVPEISALIRSRRLRRRLQELEVLDPLQLATRAEQERALLLLSVFANGWVWAGAEPNLEIPSQIAIPLCAIAAALDRPPIVHYASMALHNWRRIERNSPLSTENARMQVQFLGGVDEDWFFIGSLGVELAAAPLLPLIHAATLAAHDGDDVALADLLSRIADGMHSVLHGLARMREWCDPYVFYHRVRPFLAGWPAPGAIYRGVWSEPRSYVGGSAGQSSVIQAIDALLGIDHGDSATGMYLRGVRAYMPVGHRRFVTDIENSSRVRTRVLQGPANLRVAYNAAVDQVGLFRHRHIELARDYVTKPSGTTTKTGTGGTTFVEFLGAAQRHTIANKVSDN
jgi:indoleamine 2,3-dioxygenase